MKKELEYITAIHEAGHAVMATTLGRDIEYVSIISKERDLGTCKHIRNGIGEVVNDAVIGLTIQQECLILVAGVTAEAVILNISPKESRGKNDYEELSKIVEAPNDGQEKERYDYIHKISYGMFRESSFQQKVKAIADALMEHKTLTGEQVKKIIS